ncbi:MAG: right-handed parallel beta-helix repeat-containing protein [Chloroflexota bacterium]
MPAPEGYLPGGAYANMVALSGNGITIDGLTIQNTAGRGVSIGGSRNTVRNCRIDFCYGSGISVNSDSVVIAPLIENCTITQCSVKIYHPDRSGGGPESVDGTVNLIEAENAIVRYNIIAYNYGEGINSGKGSKNTLVEGNVVHTCNHVHLYINRSQDTTLRNNFIYHLYLKPFLSNGKAPGGIVIGDEGSENAKRYPHSSGAVIYNNIVVGMGYGFQVRNNSDNYDTQLLDSYVGYNTFVSRKMTRYGVEIKGNVQGRDHKRSIFENNIIDNNHGSISNVSGDLSGITFRHNLWSMSPANALRGEGDKIGDPRLANPEADITGSVPDSTNADPFNYRLTKNSTLAIGLAGDSTKVNGFTPPSIDRDFFNNSRDDKPDLGAHEFAGEPLGISANFSIGAGQQAGVVPHTVDFVDKSTSSATISKWSWDFGDGSTSDESNPSHTYMSSGSFTIALTVEDTDGQSDKLVEPELITALPESPEISPDDFRRFLLIAESTSNTIAYGIQYPDLSCVLLWSEEPFHVLNFASIEDIADKYQQEGEITWLDPFVETFEETMFF